MRRILVLVGLLTLSVEPRAQTGAASIEVDFAVPGGYVAQQEGEILWLRPPTLGDVRTPCAYGLLPPIPSKGSLEVDAEAALADITAKWPRVTDNRIAMRGVTAAGSPYFLLGGTFQSPNGAGLEVTAMVFPALANRVTVLFGLGAMTWCDLNDVPFAQLFHSLRPRGQPNPVGNSLERDLIGKWGGNRLSGYTFLADGRYASSAAAVLNGEPISGEGDGRYTVRGSEVSITPRLAGQTPERFRVYIYEKWNNFRWERAMRVLYDNRTPPYAAEYVREGQ